MLPAVQLDIPLQMEPDAYEAVVRACSEVVAPRFCVLRDDQPPSTLAVRVRGELEQGVDIEVCQKSSCETLQIEFRPDDPMDQRARAIGVACGALVVRVAAPLEMRSVEERPLPAKETKESTQRDAELAGLEEEKTRWSSWIQAHLGGGTGVVGLQWGASMSIGGELALTTASEGTWLGIFTEASWASEPSRDESPSATWSSFDAGISLRQELASSLSLMGAAGYRRELYSTRLKASAGFDEEMFGRSYNAAFFQIAGLIDWGRWSLLLRSTASTSPQHPVSIAGREVGRNPFPRGFYGIGVRRYFY